MERTTTCIPCVPSILEGFRRSGTGSRIGGKGGGGGKSGTGGGSSDGDEAMGNGAEYKPNPSNQSITKVNVTPAEQTVGSNATATNGSLPFVTNLSAPGSNPNNRIHPLQKGKTSFGRSALQDIVIEGPGIDDQHCYIINEGQVVTFYPLSALNSVDGFRITKPTKLYHGSVLCFGHSVYFRFDYPPQKSKTAQTISIKGSSPDDESRRRLIKLQSKPSAQEVSITKSSFPVPDASQFYWVDFDKELGLKPSSPIELKASNSGGRVTETRNASRSTISNIRPVRNSLPSSSQSWDAARLSRSRFPSQGLEIYPKENSECESPSPSATFLSSPPHFPPHDSSKSSSKNFGKFPPRPATDRKEPRRLDDESDSGTHSTETSSLSGSSLGEQAGLNALARDHNEPHRTRLNIVPTKLYHSNISTGSNSTSTSAVIGPYPGANSSANFGRFSGGYDNVASIKAAIIAAATAKLANSTPAAVENFPLTGGRVENLRASFVSKSSSLPRETSRTVCLRNSVSLEASAGSGEKRTSDGTTLQSIEPLDDPGKGNSEGRLSTSKELTDSGSPSAAVEYSVNPTDCDQQPGIFGKVLGEKPNSSALVSTSVDEVLPADEENVDVTVAYNEDLSRNPQVSNSASKPDDTAGSVEPSNSIEDRKPFIENSEDLSTVKTEPITAKEKKNSVNLTPESLSAEECVTANVCSSKPPLGKSLPESGKVVKAERRCAKSDKKSSEPTAASLFRSLLSRSRSPSPKGRAGRSDSPSSSAKDSSAEHVSRNSQRNKEPSGTFTNDDPDELAHDLVERIKTSAKPDTTNILDKSSSDELSGSSENPWRVNLRQNLRPNLENFKGEKVFTKDTVTTNIFVGVGSDGSRVTPRASLTSFETPAHADVDFGYISDSGISAAKYSGRIAKFCQPKGKKSVTFAEEYRKGSLTLEKNGQQLPLEISPAMSKDMDRVVEVRSPTEKISVSEQVRTYLEMVDSSGQKGNTAANQTDHSGKDQPNRTANENGVCDFETDDFKNLKSKVIESNELLGLPSEFNCRSSNGSDVEIFGPGKEKAMDERQSVSLYDFDVDDLGASQQDLKQLYQQQRAERLEEQRRAKVEKQRLQEILKMCSQFGVNTDLETAENCDPNSNADHGGSGPSDSEDAAEEHGTIKRCPPLVADKPIPLESQMLDRSSLVRLENSLNDARGVSPAAANRTLEDDLGPASPVLDGGIDVGTTDRPLIPLHSKEFSSAFRDRRPSEESRPSLYQQHLDGRRPSDNLEGRRPSDEYWSTSEYEPRHLTNDTDYLRGSYSSKRIFHKPTWNVDEKSKHVQLGLLRDLQRDVVRSITDIKQKISDIESRQSEAVREVEMERALLEGEQQIQMEQLDRIKEKIVSLEMKETNLLAEAASRGAKEVEKIRLERDRLSDLERQLRSSKDFASRNSAVDEAEALNRRCSEMQDAVDNHRFLVDNLEFQQLEVEAHFEEEKESVQKELTSERAYLDSLSNQHQVTLKQVALQQSDLLKQVDFDVFELEKERQRLAELFQKENAVLYSINCQIQDSLPSSVVENDNQDEDIRISNRWRRPRLSEAEIEAVSRSSHGSPQKLSAKFSHTIPKIDSQRTRSRGEASDDEDSRFLFELTKRSTSRLMWERSCDLPDGGGGGGGGDGALVQWQGPGSSAPTGNSESSDSSISGSDPLSDKAMSLSSKEDQLHDMECLLVLARAEGLRLVEEQMHQRDIEREALDQERRRRKELEFRLAEEIAKHNDVIEQAIRLREKEKLQARPLTRYLPVRDRSLDLQQFIVAAGHSVDQCAHLAMTSTSCRGYLTKMGSRIRTWKKRWFVFDRTKHCLSYYGDRSESRPRGVIYFQAVEDVFVDHLHQVKSPTPQLTFCVKTYDRMYYLMAPSPDAMRIWIDVIFTGAEGYQQFA